jgi:hypothetical protein
MRSPYNAVADVMSELGMLQSVRETVTQDPENPRRWLITFESIPFPNGPRIHIEVIEGEPHPYACVLERRSCGYRSMTRIMDKLMDRLEAPRASPPSGQRPSGGSPPSSPGPNRNGLLGDDN